jgi:hypothetical protein
MLFLTYEESNVKMKYIVTYVKVYVSMRISVFYVTTPCSLLHGYLRGVIHQMMFSTSLRVRVYMISHSVNHCCKVI